MLVVRLFGHATCPQTNVAWKQLSLLSKRKNWSDRVQIVWHDLSTADGLAEAAYYQLEGDLQTILVDVVRSENAATISGEEPYSVADCFWDVPGEAALRTAGGRRCPGSDRKVSPSSVTFGLLPSWN